MYILYCSTFDYCFCEKKAFFDEVILTKQWNKGSFFNETME